MKDKPIITNGMWLAVCLTLTTTLTGFAQTVITENNSGTYATAGNGFALGQSVTIPSGNSWDSISFNLVDSITKSPYAFGELFLLSASYSGTVAGLSSSTSGFLASTTDIVNGEWVFAPDVTLAPSTQYYFYNGTQFDGSHEISFGLGSYSGGAASQATGSGLYAVAGNADLVFTLSGTEVAVPEPTTLALAGLAGLALPLFRRRK